MTKFDEYKELAKQGVYTHSATFHADDVEVGKNGCTFIHATRFMAVFDNKYAAVNCTIN